MPRRKIQFKTKIYYHIYNRGACRCDIFRAKCDYNRFLKKAGYYAAKFNISINSYALMNNHFHFLLTQNAENGIQCFLQKVQQSHSLYFNLRYKRSGALFESRFKAKEVNKEDYFSDVRKYIINNPLKSVGVSSSGLNCLG